VGGCGRKCSGHHPAVLMLRRPRCLTVYFLPFRVIFPLSLLQDVPGTIVFNECDNENIWKGRRKAFTQPEDFGFFRSQFSGRLECSSFPVVALLERQREQVGFGLGQEWPRSARIRIRAARPDAGPALFPCREARDGHVRGLRESDPRPVYPPGVS
jgi:hypothetical protein